MGQMIRIKGMCFGGDELVDKSVACFITGLSMRTLEDWTSKRKLPIYKLGPKTVRYRVREVLDWVNAQAVTIPQDKE